MTLNKKTNAEDQREDAQAGDDFCKVDEDPDKNVYHKKHLQST